MQHQTIMPHLQLENITIAHDRWRCIVRGACGTVPRGGRLAIFGPSGAGKSSLLRVINRLAEPAEGRVLLDGVDIRTLDPIALRRRVGMLFQQPFLFDATVADNLAYPRRLQQRALPDDEAAALLAEVSLPADYLSRRAQQLSGGEQQRVALARALSLSPELLLLDEPTSALDDDHAHLLLDALLRRNAAGLTLVMVSHARELLLRFEAPLLHVQGGEARWLPALPQEERA